MSNEKRSYEQRVRAERRLETRRRIVEATVALHEEVGPARTTIAEIARRARVTRLTVYHHFPDERQLFQACQAHYLSARRMPDFESALAEDDPRASLHAALVALYGNYRSRQPMLGNVLRDRHGIAALDQLMADTLDTQLSDLRGQLTRRLRAHGRRRQALLALALDFHTWKTMADQGLNDRASAELMVQIVFADFGGYPDVELPRRLADI
jgi:AcrR family transcriptional regulator